MMHSEDRDVEAPTELAARLEQLQLAQLLSTARRRRAVVIVAALALLVCIGAVASALDAVAATAGLSWSTGLALGALLILTWTLCAHAGGHAWLVPVPAGALAVLWFVAVASGSRSSVTAWWLAGASSGLVAVAATVAGTVFRQGAAVAGPFGSPLGGADGVAVSVLDPIGVVQVAGESWTAESVSGTLPVGAAVHVISTQGLRLRVWSEQGIVPGPEVLGSEEVSS